MRIFGLAGWSGSGKTTLLAALIPELVARGVSVSTIKAHLTKIFRKLGQPDRVRLALFAAALGLQTPQES